MYYVRILQNYHTAGHDLDDLDRDLSDLSVRRASLRCREGTSTDY